MKLVPKILGFQCDFGVVVDFLVGLQALHAAEMSRLMVAEGRVEPSLRRPGQAVVRDGLGERAGRQAQRREEGRLRGRQKGGHGEVGRPVCVERVISHCSPCKNWISHRCIHKKRSEIMDILVVFPRKV